MLDEADAQTRFCPTTLEPEEEPPKVRTFLCPSPPFSTQEAEVLLSFAGLVMTSDFSCYKFIHLW